MKSMPKVSAARSMAWASGVKSASGQAAAICATGVTETRLLAMGDTVLALEFCGYGDEVLGHLRDMVVDLGAHLSYVLARTAMK